MEELIQIAYAVDTFYFLLMGALVMFMAPGFAMLEAGMVRVKNTSEILTKNIALFSIACIMYMVIGYDFMYDGGMFLGTDNTLEDALAAGGFAAGGWTDAATDGYVFYSAKSDFFFQVVFVATAMSIISGAVAERIKLWPFLIFAVVMTGFIYPIQGNWSWGGGFLGETWGYVDFAGSGIVHMCGAAAALAGVIVLGPRTGKYNEDGSINAMPGANMPLATLGTFVLWFGWFGFNGGSQLILTGIENANAIAMVFVNTNMAAACGAVAALIVARLIFGKADITMALNGALAGLVAITAEPASGSHIQSMIIGAVGGAIVVGSITLLDKIKIDDPVGAISVHGTVGIFGVLAAIWTTSGNGDDAATLVGQLVGIGAIFGWTFGVSLVIWLALKFTVGVRLSPEEEEAGSDATDIGVAAYPEFKG